MADTQHGKGWEAIADWRVRWAAVVVTVALAGVAFATGYGSLKRAVDDGIGKTAIIEMRVAENSKNITTLQIEGALRDRRLNEHVALPVHSQTVETVGRMDERLKALETLVGKVDSKMDKLLLQSGRGR